MKQEIEIGDKVLIKIIDDLPDGDGSVCFEGVATVEDIDKIEGTNTGILVLEETPFIGKISEVTEVYKAPKVYTMWEHSGWGNELFWSDWENRKVAGFLKDIPKEGDILRARMESGKIARFKFESVERMTDPKDQFFATLTDMEYE